MKPTDLAFPCGQWAGPCELRDRPAGADNRKKKTNRKKEN